MNVIIVIIIYECSINFLKSHFLEVYYIISRLKKNTSRYSTKQCLISHETCLLFYSCDNIVLYCIMTPTQEQLLCKFVPSLLLRKFTFQQYLNQATGFPAYAISNLLIRNEHIVLWKF